MSISNVAKQISQTKHSVLFRCFFSFWVLVFFIIIILLRASGAAARPRAAWEPGLGLLHASARLLRPWMGDAVGR